MGVWRAVSASWTSLVYRPSSIPGLWEAHCMLRMRSVLENSLLPRQVSPTWARIRSLDNRFLTMTGWHAACPCAFREGRTPPRAPVSLGLCGSSRSLASTALPLVPPMSAPCPTGVCTSGPSPTLCLLEPRATGPLISLPQGGPFWPHFLPHQVTLLEQRILSLFLEALSPFVIESLLV